jgi:hypothetical protein
MVSFVAVSMAMALAPAISFGAAATAPIDETVPVGAFGRACRLYGTNELGPANYRVTDLGKPGVPTLSSDQRNIVARIAKHLRTDGTLWFTFAPNADGSHEFIVFETSGLVGPKYAPEWVPPCIGVPPGYPVLNLPCDCWYESSESRSYHIIPGDRPAPKPWLSPEP